MSDAVLKIPLSDATLLVSCVQMESFLEPERNLALCLSHLVEAEQVGVNLIVFPESTSSRTDEPGRAPVSEPLNGPFVEGLCEWSSNSDITIIVGITERNDIGNPYNTIVAIRRGAIISIYRKLHLYDACDFKESEAVSPGQGPLTTFDVKGFSVGIMTCYDIRFPEVARLLASQGADLIAVPTSWVAGPFKEAHWRLFCQSRAVENNVYLAGAGQTGGIRVGLSTIVGPDGASRASLGRETQSVTATLNKEVLRSSRAAFPLLDQRRFIIDPSPVAHGTMDGHFLKERGT